MKIGLTYDLRSEYLSRGYDEEQTAEFDREDTIEAIEGALKTLGHQTERIGHAKQLVAALVKGKRWDLVFNIAEGFKKNGKRDKARFYNIAQGSLEECRYYLILAEDLGYGGTSALKNQSAEVSKLLDGYIKGLFDKKG